MNPGTLPALLAERARLTPEATAFRSIVAARVGPAVTWARFASAADSVACALSNRGLARGDRIGILARTCIEWEYAQMGALRLGAVVVGIDPNYADDTLRTVFGSLGLAAIVVGDPAALARIPADVRKSAKFIMTMTGAASPDDRTLCIGDALATEPTTLHALPPLSGADLAIVVFSSGTTGSPRPIGYTHQQVVAAVEAIVAAFPDMDAGSSLLCWLPLANLFQRIINFCAIARGATNFVINDPREVMDALPVAAPNLLIGVPRFYERVHQGMIQRVASLGGVRGALARWALGVLGRRAEARATLSDRMLGPVAGKLVFPQMRRVFGARVRYLVSGSAPMPESLLRWYEALGLHVYEAYGISENIVPIAMNRPGHRRLGSVGKPLPMNGVRIGADGEILVRGPGLFAGYLGDPGINAFAAEPAPAKPSNVTGVVGAPSGAKPLVGSSMDGDAFAAEAAPTKPSPMAGVVGDPFAAEAAPAMGHAAFWPTGDVGAFDADGYLYVTGRKADAFKSAGGRWIAPARIEALLRSVPSIDQVVIVGSGRPALIAIASVSADALGAAAGAGSYAQGAAGSNALGESGMRVLRDAVRTATGGLPADERPQALLVSMQPFTIAGGELTSNLKLRRKAVEEKFRTAIDDVYEQLREARKRAAADGVSFPLVLECR